MYKRKIHYAFAYFVLFVVLILQTTLMNEIMIFGVIPSAVLGLVVCFCLMNDCIPSAVFAVTAGFLLDITGGRIIGFNALLMLYLSLAVVFIGQDFFRQTFRSAIVLVMVGTFLYELIYFIFGFAIFGSGHFFYMVAKVILPECVYNGIVVIPIYFFSNKFLKIHSSRSLID